MSETEVASSSRAGYFFRASLLAYLLLIVYASWFPFSGWREAGVGFSKKIEELHFFS